MNYVTIDLDILGRGIIKVNDDNMSDIADGVQVMAASGQPTQVFIALKAGVRYEGEAQVNIVRNATSSAEDVLEFLEGLSPRAVEQRALDALTWGDNEPMAQRIIEIIKDEVSQYVSQLGGGT